MEIFREDLTGYQIQQRLGQTNGGAVYATLERLRQIGVVEGRLVKKEGEEREIIHWVITEKGRQEYEKTRKAMQEVSDAHTPRGDDTNSRAVLRLRNQLGGLTD